MQKDFITVSPDSGNGDGIITVTTPANSGVARSTALTISGGGITKTIESLRQLDLYQIHLEVIISLLRMAIEKLLLAMFRKVFSQYLAVVQH